MNEILAIFSILMYKSTLKLRKWLDFHCKNRVWEE